MSYAITYTKLYVSVRLKSININYKIAITLSRYSAVTNTQTIYSYNLNPLFPPPLSQHTRSALSLSLSLSLSLHFPVLPKQSVEKCYSVQ